MSQLNIDDVKSHIEGTVIEIACLACSAGSIRMTVCSDFVGDRLTPVYTIVRKLDNHGVHITRSFNEDELAEAVNHYNKCQLSMLRNKS